MARVALLLLFSLGVAEGLLSSGCRLLRSPGGVARSLPLASAPDDFETLDVRTHEQSQAAHLSDFGALGVTVPEVVPNLEGLNISQPNALQAAVFAPLASGRDAIIAACTGSGKTLAFLLPLLEQLDGNSKEPQALVLCPSRELAFQTARVAEKVLEGSPLRVVAVAGGANAARQIERVRKVRPQLLVGTAGRVCELTFEMRKLKLQRVRHLVIDEVDDALRGANLDSTAKLIQCFRDGRPLQIIFASATADTPMVRRSAMQLLDKPLMIRLMGAERDGVVSELPEGISHGVYVLPAQKHLDSIRQLANSDPKPRCIVFVDSPHRARIICDKLANDLNIDAVPLHGQQEREQKVAVMRKLVEGKVRFVVSTEMGARGLDLPDLTHVVNLDLPTDHRHYVHRAGRTGRAGAKGMVISVVAPNRLFVVEKQTKQLGLQLQHVRLSGGKLVPASKARSSPTKKRSKKVQGVQKADIKQSGGSGSARQRRLSLSRRSVVDRRAQQPADREDGPSHVKDKSKQIWDIGASQSEAFVWQQMMQWSTPATELGLSSK